MNKNTDPKAHVLKYTCQIYRNILCLKSNYAFDYSPVCIYITCQIALKYKFLRFFYRLSLSEYIKQTVGCRQRMDEVIFRFLVTFKM